MKRITVKCPGCREVLEVDARTGAVLAHHPEVSVKGGGDFLGQRLRELEQEKGRRESLVAEGRAREQAKKDRFDELFSKVREEGKSGRPAERPLRDVDID